MCVAPVTIGRWAMVAAGSVVIKDVPDFALVAGVPARRIRWVGRAGVPLEAGDEPGTWVCPQDRRDLHRGRRQPDGGRAVTDFIPPAKPLIGDEERAAVDRVLRSGMLAQGPEVKAFEEEFSAHFGLGRACVAVNSGTRGQHLGLLSSGVKAGDEVIVPSFTFAATCNSVALTGATPVFADIDADDFCISPGGRRGQRSPTSTVGIMPVHLYGHPAKMDQIMAIADKHGLQVFEDAAQAHGASLNGTPVGAFGTFAMFSLYPTKNMTSGEGGMVSVADRRDRAAHAALPQPGHGEAVPQRGRRLQHPHDRHPRRHRPRAADQGRRLDRARARRTPPSSPPTSRASRRRRSPRAPCTSTTSTRCASPRTATASPPRSRRSTTSARACSTRCPTTGCRRSRSTSTCPRPSKAAAECLSLPVHPSLSQADLERIVEAVNALAKAGA